MDGTPKLGCWIAAWSVAAVLSGTAVAATDPPVPPATAPAARGLTFEEATRLLKSRNRELQLARRNVDFALADQLSARARPNPSVSVAANALHQRIGVGPGPDGGRADVIVGVSQLLERGNKRELRGDAAERAVAASRADLADALRQQEVVLAGAYYDLLFAQERLRVAGETVELLARSVSATEVRLKAGDVAQSDLARIKVDRLRVENDLRQARADRDRSRQALAFLVGLEREADTLVAVDPWPTDAGMPLPADVGVVIERRADVSAARERLRAAEKVRELAQALRTRDVTVSGQYERFPAQTNNGTLGVGVSVPLFVNYAFDGEIRRAETGVATAQDLLERARAAAGTEIARAWSDLTAARDRVRRFDTELLREAERASEAAEFAYRHGALGVIDLLDARRVFYATRTDAIAARSDLARALAVWRAAVATYEVSS